ncbi:hypothetical protein AAC387_Pa05g3633 [Persea americana]
MKSKSLRLALATSKMVAEAHDDNEEQASGSGELLELDDCSGSSLISSMLRLSVTPSLLLSSSSFFFFCLGMEWETIGVLWAFFFGFGIWPKKGEDSGKRVPVGFGGARRLGRLVWGGWVAGLGLGSSGGVRGLWAAGGVWQGGGGLSQGIDEGAGFWISGIRQGFLR